MASFESGSLKTKVGKNNTNSSKNNNSNRNKKQGIRFRKGSKDGSSKTNITDIDDRSSRANITDIDDRSSKTNSDGRSSRASTNDGSSRTNSDDRSNRTNITDIDSKSNYTVNSVNSNNSNINIINDINSENNDNKEFDTNHPLYKMFEIYVRIIEKLPSYCLLTNVKNELQGYKDCVLKGRNLDKLPPKELGDGKEYYLWSYWHTCTFVIGKKAWNKNKFKELAVKQYISIARDYIADIMRK